MSAVSYNPKTDVYTGELFVFIDGEPLAFASSAQLQVTQDTKDASNKMSGSWDIPIPGKKNFQVTADSLLTALTGSKNYKVIIDAIISGATFAFSYANAKKTETGDSATYAVDSTQANFSGTLLPTECTLKSDNGTIASCAATFKGVGALVSTAGVPAA